MEELRVEYNIPDLSKLDQRIEKVEDEITTYKIHSFLDFEILLSEIYKRDRMINMGDYAYRGVQNKAYGLETSLSYTGLIEYESEMIHSLRNSMPGEFLDCKDTYTMVAKMQHYGLPTRLLDFSRNPLVALWFACDDEGHTGKDVDKDGLVYIWVCAMMLSYENLNKIFDYPEFICQQSGPNNKDLESEYFENHAKFCEAICVSQRERNQQSLFMVGINRMSAFWCEDEKFVSTEDEKEIPEGKNVIWNCLGTMCATKDEMIDNCIKVVVPKEAKKEILEELEIRGITRDFLFPEIHNKAATIKNRYLRLAKTQDLKD